MNKMIIHSDLSDFQSAYYVLQVIKQGKISKDEAQYCSLTRFKNDVTVVADITRKGTHVFHVSAPENGRKDK